MIDTDSRCLCDREGKTREHAVAQDKNRRDDKDKVEDENSKRLPLRQQHPLANAELAHFAKQRAAAHVQHKGRLALMPVAGMQGLHNAFALTLAR